MNTPLSSNDEQWLQVLAFLYLQQQQHNNAVTVLEALLVLSPSNQHANKMLALAYLNNQQYQSALLLVDELIIHHEKCKENAPLWLIRAKALWGLKQTKAARAALLTHQQLHALEDQPAKPLAFGPLDQ